MNENSNIWSNKYNPFQSFKVLCFLDHFKAIKAGKFLPAVNAAIDPLMGTGKEKKCGKGFNCNFCLSNWKEHEKPAIMPRDIFLALPDFLGSWGLQSICLAGSHADFTMYNHNDIAKFLRSCTRNNIDVGAVSNGAYYSKKLLEEVARSCNWAGFSLNAGNAEDHKNITGTPDGTFQKIINNIQYLGEYCKEYDLKCKTGYKFLITDDNYTHLYDGIEFASKLHVRHFQIRPCDLPIERSEKIDINEVERQIKEGLKLERPGEFEIFGVREKFTPDFKKITPWKCIASPLGITIKANGNCVICPDSRQTDDDPDRVLCNIVKEGLDAITKEWSGLRHKRMIKIANERICSCHRCTSIHFHNLYYHTMIEDSMDYKLI